QRAGVLHGDLRRRAADHGGAGARRYLGTHPGWNRLGDASDTTRPRRERGGGHAMTDILTINGLVRRFGGVTALAGLVLSLKAGQIRALIGPNGSGKSTLINCVSAVDRWDEGTIVVDGAPVKGRDSVAAARRGIARTFQTLRLFDDMTVLENVMVAMHHS